MASAPWLLFDLAHPRGDDAYRLVKIDFLESTPTLLTFTYSCVM